MFLRVLAQVTNPISFGYQVVRCESSRVRRLSHNSLNEQESRVSLVLNPPSCQVSMQLTLPVDSEKSYESESGWAPWKTRLLRMRRSKRVLAVVLIVIALTGF